MSKVIEVESLSKRYILGTRGHETTLRERLMNLGRSALRREKRKTDILWALRDVSFSVKEGEVVGIVGRNGAGKSTLLKVLSKITYPTSGRIRVQGRLSALLEVGTGFHEELTGRENIYLNGSILGMKKREVDARMDSIVEFSGVERFLDTPIKRYSSGMRLRLGFAVAAHLAPDILVVDEVLAVGDASFQKKCLNAMEGLRSGGRTVLFVSHNMAAVENLCSRAIWIDGGEVRDDGPTQDVIKAYMSTFSDSQEVLTDLTRVVTRRGTGEIRYTGIEFLSPDGQRQLVTRTGDSVIVRMHYHSSTTIPGASLGFRMYTEMGTLIMDTSTWHHALDVPDLNPGHGHIELEIDALNLLPGRYTFSLGLTGHGGHLYDYVDNCARLDVEVSNLYNSGRVFDSRVGIVYLPQRWRLNGALISKDSLQGNRDTEPVVTEDRLAP